MARYIQDHENNSPKVFHNNASSLHTQQAKVVTIIPAHSQTSASIMPKFAKQAVTQS